MVLPLVLTGISFSGIVCTARSVVLRPDIPPVAKARDLPIFILQSICHGVCVNGMSQDK